MTTKKNTMTSKQKLILAVLNGMSETLSLTTVIIVVALLILPIVVLS